MSALARRQHGVVARRQLLQIGLGRQAIATRMERGLLHEVHRGVYLFGTRRITRKGRWMAAILASGARAVLSHRSAARLWGVMPYAAEWAEVTSPPPLRARRERIASHRGLIQGDEWEVVDGIPVTAVFRTIFDLAAVVEMRQLERAWHEALVRELTAAVSLPVLLDRYPGRRGNRKLRALLESELPVGITRNDFEEAFLVLVDAYGLPRPRMNATIALRGRFFEIDALWKRERVAVELDSRSVHTTPRNFESDRLRDRILTAEGFRTVHVTWRQLKHEPAAIVADLQLALGSPGPQPHPHGK